MIANAMRKRKQSKEVGTGMKNTLLSSKVEVESVVKGS